MTEDIVVRVSNLTKEYKLYEQPSDRLKESFSLTRRKYHKTFRAVEDVSFVIRRGESLGIIGRNGSGKSTLLKMISGVLTPSGGSIEVGGKVSALLELGSGFNPELTGIENVYFYGALHGWPKVEMEDKLDDILGFADIGDFVRQPVKTYSSGMMMRLAFSVATAIRPEVLIVDEALTVGDAAFQAKSKFRMNSLIDSGTAAILVAHDIDSIKELTKTCLYLKAGHSMMLGPTSQVVPHYQKDLREDVISSGIAGPFVGAERSLNVSNRLVSDIPQNLAAKRGPGFFEVGEKAAEIVGFQVLNQHGEMTSNFAFGDTMVLRLSIQGSVEQTVNVVCGLSDRNLRLVTHGSILELTDSLTKVGPEAPLLVTFTTPICFTQGTYIVGAAIEKPMGENVPSLAIHGIQNLTEIRVSPRLPRHVIGLVSVAQTVQVELVDASQQKATSVPGGTGD
jgi:ABC-type polysaccharide/polyol phosphate transport system ATPase subunit